MPEAANEVVRNARQDGGHPIAVGTFRGAAGAAVVVLGAWLAWLGFEASGHNPYLTAAGVASEPLLYGMPAGFPILAGLLMVVAGLALAATAIPADKWSS